jgi:hypothetical protein
MASRSRDRALVATIIVAVVIPLVLLCCYVVINSLWAPVHRGRDWRLEDPSAMAEASERALVTLRADTGFASDVLPPKLIP